MNPLAVSRGVECSQQTKLAVVNESHSIFLAFGFVSRCLHNADPVTCSDGLATSAMTRPQQWLCMMVYVDFRTIACDVFVYWVKATIYLGIWSYSLIWFDTPAGWQFTSQSHLRAC